MRRTLLALLFVSLPAQPAFPAEAGGKLLKEVWEAAYLEGVQAGFVHSVYREIESGEQKIIEATVEIDLSLNRFNQALRLNFIVGNHETADGKVLAVVSRQNLSKDQRLLIKGKVEGKELKVHIENGQAPTREKIVPWNEAVVGLWGQERLFQNRKREPNTSFDYLRYESVFTSVIKATVQIKDLEEVTLPDGRKEKLLRTETRIPKIMEAEFPPTIAWINDAGEPVKVQMEMPGLGQLVTFRTTQAMAMMRGGQAPVDIGLGQLIRLRTPILRPNDTREVVYRIRLKGVENPQTALKQDDRQEIRKIDGEMLELVVRGLDEPSPAASAPARRVSERHAQAPQEYLKSNHFIRSDDPRVRKLAEEAVASGGRETPDPWRRAQKIERWVYDHIRDKNFTEAFATADEVAKKLEGDCTEHAVLAAAMCRAAGVPARTAVGLIYAPRDRAMGFHMWIEVWINGKWHALDPTLGQGKVGAAHLKITDHHWNDVQSMTPLLPVTRVIGKIQIEVVSVKH